MAGVKDLVGEAPKLDDEQCSEDLDPDVEQPVNIMDGVFCDETPVRGVFQKPTHCKCGDHNEAKGDPIGVVPSEFSLHPCIDIHHARDRDGDAHVGEGELLAVIWDL